MELADVVNYCILMADKLDVDLEDIVLKNYKLCIYNKVLYKYAVLY